MKRKFRVGEVMLIWRQNNEEMLILPSLYVDSEWILLFKVDMVKIDIPTFLVLFK